MEGGMVGCMVGKDPQLVAKVMRGANEVISEIFCFFGHFE
jgi:hypothetical protein